MITDIGMIVVSIISLAGMVLLFTLNNSTWFKKENFKIRKKNMMDENRLKIKKLERELGIEGATQPYRETQTPLETGANLLDVAKNLSADQLQGLADKFLNPDDAAEYGDEPKGTLESLLEFANKNPEMAQQFLKGIAGKKGEDIESVFNK